MKYGRKWLLLLPILVIYIIGMFIDVMEVDAAQYATMSLEMTQTGNYLQLHSRGEDYIDKPPMIFWTSALSFNLFGPGNFSYKLPSILFTILGLFSTYRLGRMYYGRWTGYFAALILASCHAWFQFNNDVRTDAILAACTIFAVWQLAEYATSKKLLALILAGIGIAGAMLAKGPVGAMVPALAIGTDLLLKRDWRTLFRWQWLLLIPVVLICLSPMLYGLYEQYDASGGRQTYNGFITSGIRFYFWTQSFGRLTGESSWSNDTTPFYFVHTFLWAFLPWSLLFLIALGKKLKKIIFNGLIIKRRNEALTIGGTIFPFIAFSMSHYKLPHYIFVLFPLCAILTGGFVRKLVKKYDGDLRSIKIIQHIVSTLLLGLGVYLLTLFPINNIFVIIIATLGVFMTVYYMVYRGTQFKKVLFPSFFAIITLNFIFNVYFYPNLLQYESGNVAAKIANRKKLDLVGLNQVPYGMDFYYKQPVPFYSNVDEMSLRGKNVLVYTDVAGATQLRNSPVEIVDDTVLQHFHVSSLTGRFLDPGTRKNAVGEMHLLNVKF
ncbi:MAG TPA: glycosyltransferase family 39 protein [Cyclobacteriaceae bacterium]